MRSTPYARTFGAIIVKVQEGISTTIEIFRVVVSTVEASHKREARRSS
jgi:hypothetical protein